MLKAISRRPERSFVQNRGTGGGFFIKKIQPVGPLETMAPQVQVQLAAREHDGTRQCPDEMRNLVRRAASNRPDGDKELAASGRAW